MAGEVHYLPGSEPPPGGGELTGSGRGGGPEGPDMETRVQRLEGDVAEIKSMLGRLEPLIRAQSAVLDALRDRVAETRDDMRGMREEMGLLRDQTRQELGQFRDQTRQELAHFGGDLSRTREEMGEIRGRLSSLPTRWEFFIGVGALIVAVLALRDWTGAVGG